LKPARVFEAPDVSVVEGDVVVVGAGIDVLLLEGTAEDVGGLAAGVETVAAGPPHALRASPAASATALASDNRETEIRDSGGISAQTTWHKLRGPAAVMVDTSKTPPSPRSVISWDCSHPHITTATSTDNQRT
jgi:hypothetical protein